MARTFVSTNPDHLTYAGAVVTAEPFTISAWFKKAALTTEALVSVDDNATGYSYLSPRSDGTLFAVSSGPNYSTASGTYSTGVWQHAAGVFTSTSSRTAYLNGVAGAANTATRPATTFTQTNVGILWASLQAADGEIAEVAIWNIALSAADIASLALGVSPLLIRPDALVFYAPIDGRSPEIDIIGRHDLVVTGTTVAAHPRIFVAASRHSLPSKAYTISGTTKNSSGVALASCTVKLFRTSDDVEIATTTSDGSGNYSLTVVGGVSYYIVAYKAGSPDVAGTTVNTLVGV